jgi:hypothetical protein
MHPSFDPVRPISPSIVSNWSFVYFYRSWSCDRCAYSKFPTIDFRPLENWIDCEKSGETIGRNGWRRIVRRRRNDRGGIGWRDLGWGVPLFFVKFINRMEESALVFSWGSKGLAYQRPKEPMHSF